MRKLYLSVLLFCGVIFIALFFQHNGSESTDISSTLSPKLPETFLWKVAKEGAPTSYLLGTLHIGLEGDVLAPHIVQALYDSNVLVTEVNVMPDLTEIMTLGQLMLDMNGSLSEKLGDTRFSQLAEQLTSQVSTSGLDRMKPWAALTLVIYNKPEGYSEAYGIDMLLTQKAQQEGKRRVFLESIEESVQVFVRLPEDKAIFALNLILDNGDEARAETTKLSEMYRNNRSQEVAELFADKEQLLAFYPREQWAFWEQWILQDLLVNRNNNWMPVLTHQLATEPTLIAVGAAHLFGEQGLMEQFESLGYTLTPIMPH